jgi:hypothetical protein
MPLPLPLLPVGEEPPLLMPPVLDVLRVPVVDPLLVPVAPVLPVYCANAGEAARTAATATQARVRNVLMNHPLSFAARSGMLRRGHVFPTLSTPGATESIHPLMRK